MRNRKLFIYTFFAILIIVLLLTVSCKKAAVDSTTFRFNNGAEPQSLDPAIATGVPEFRITLNISEGLTTSNPKDLSPVPGVAESWTVSDDGLVYTFKLRQNAKWSDGVPIDAGTFKYSWMRVLKPETAAEYAYQLWYIKNAEDYTSGKAKAEDVGIEVVDKYTLKVTLKAPTPFFTKLTAFLTLRPVPMHTIAKVGEDKWYLKGNIVCNGPFKLVEWEPNNFIKLVKNETYWDAEKVKLANIMIYPLDDANTALEMYLNDELDMITDIPLERIEEMAKRSDYYKAGYLGTYYYRVNVKSESPLNDVRVRKALYLTINRDYIIKYILKAGQLPAYGFVPRNMPGYSGFDGPKENVEEAKKLLAEAGFPGGKGFPRLTILYNTSEAHKKIAEAIQQMWNEALGINILLENQEWKVYLDRQSNLDYNISRAGWIGDYVDPNTFMDMFVTDGGHNQTGFSNAQYDEFIKKAQFETNLDTRNKYYYEAEKILMTEFPIIPIYYYVMQNMIKKYVKGIFGNILDEHPLKEVYIQP